MVHIAVATAVAVVVAVVVEVEVMIDRLLPIMPSEEDVYDE